LHGESPQEVKITKIVTSIPSPQIVSYWQPAKFRGRIDPRTGVTSGQPYEPRKLKSRETDVQTHKCRGDGELPLHIKERYGLPVTDADRTRAEREATDRARKFTSRRDRWEKRRDWGRWFADDEDKV
jgi:hypothetical protein